MGTKFKAELIETVLFSRWESPPSKEDVLTVVELMKKARETAGRPVIYLASVAATSKTPDSTQQHNLREMLNSGREYCEAAFLILEGESLQHKLQRLTLSSVLLLARVVDKFLTMSRTTDEIVAEVSKVLKKDAGPLFQEARARGLVS